MHATLLPLLLLLSTEAGPPALAEPSPEGAGVHIADFSLRDPQGRSHRLKDWHDRSAVVVVFLAVDCPLARLYAPRLVELARTYEPRGVAFVVIDPNQHDELADLARYARQHELPFPVLRDVGHVVADRFRAQRSPEAFVLDRQRVVRYRGRIDDQYGVGVQKPAPGRRDVALALDEVLAGRPVSVAVTTAPGCPLSRGQEPKKESGPTYSKEVAPILQRRCQVCHRDGQSAPFSLLTYADASGWAGAIAEVVEQGRMPPWGRTPGMGSLPMTRA
jgi:peroxiredoxin